MHETNAEFEPRESEMNVNIWAFGIIFIVFGVIAILYYLRYVQFSYDVWICASMGAVCSLELWFGVFNLKFVIFVWIAHAQWFIESIFRLFEKTCITSEIFYKKFVLHTIAVVVLFCFEI